MTTAEFISKNFGVSSTRDRSCSSVWADNDGNIYSYGRHYPLLFTIDGVDFRNCTGYSNSTAKHINWAGGHGAIDLWVSGCNMYTWNNPENSAKIPALLQLARYGMTPVLKKALKKAVLADLKAEEADIQKRMDQKKRKNTQVWQSLVVEMADNQDRMARVKSAWGVK